MKITATRGCAHCRQQFGRRVGKGSSDPSWSATQRFSRALQDVEVVDEALRRCSRPR
jgi:hypothetical protein